MSHAWGPMENDAFMSCVNCNCFLGFVLSPCIVYNDECNEQECCEAEERIAQRIEREKEAAR